MNFNSFILFFAVISLSSLVNIFCIKKISSKRVEFNIINTVIFIVATIIVMFNNLQNNILLLLPINFVVMLILNRFIFKIDKNIIFKYLTVYFIIGITIDIMLSILLIIFGFNNIIEFNNDNLFKSLYTLIHSIFVILLFYNKKTYSIIDSIVVSIEKIENQFVIITIFVFISSLLMKFNVSEKIMIKKYLSIILIFTFLLMLIIKLYKSIYKNSLLINNLIKAEKINNEYRLMKHNILNDLIHIKTSKTDEIVQETINKYLEEKNNNINLGIIKDGINGIIYYKMPEIIDNKISIYINNELEENIENLIPARQYKSFCDIFSILIDNAQDAACCSEKKNIYINIYKNNEVLNLMVANSFNNKIDLDQLENINYSTKLIPSGLGLFYINKINDNKFKINRIIKEDVFITKVLWKINNDIKKI